MPTMRLPRMLRIRAMTLLYDDYQYMIFYYSTGFRKNLPVFFPTLYYLQSASASAVICAREVSFRAHWILTLGSKMVRSVLSASIFSITFTA